MKNHCFGILLAFLFSASLAQAQSYITNQRDVPFQWDASPTATTYTLYRSATPTMTAPVSLSVGNVTSFTWPALSDNLHYIAVTASNAGGESGYSNIINVTVDTILPVISAVTAAGITTTAATINWTTNEPSDSQVESGLTTSYGRTTTLDPARTLAHSQALTGLIAGTLYHYRIRSADAAGNVTLSPDFTFTTTALPPPPPPPGNLRSTVPLVVSLTGVAAQIAWKTETPATGTLELFDVSGVSIKSVTANTLPTFDHFVNVSSLVAKKFYSYRVSSKDASGNEIYSAVGSFVTK